MHRYNKVRGVLQTLLAIVFICMTVSSHAQQTRIGFFHAPPHIFEINGEVQGALHNMLIDIYGPETVFQKINLARVLVELERNQIDMLAVMAKKPILENKVIFSNTSFFQAQPSLVVQKSHPLRELKASDLNDLQIMAIKSSFLSPLLRNRDLELLSGANGSERGIKMIARGRVDALYLPSDSVAEFTIQRFQLTEQLKVLQLPEATIPMYSLFAKHRNDLQQRYEEFFNSRQRHPADKYLQYLERFAEQANSTN